MRIVNALMRPGATFQRLKYRILCTFGHSDFRHFIILTRSRSGSNMLVSFLNSHPNIRADGEVFSKLNGRRHEAIFAKAFSKQPKYIKAKGFKVFYYHPLDDDSDVLWEYLTSLDGLRVIHLRRRNILRTLISRKIAGIHDVWRVPSTEKHKTVKKTSVTFTPAELEEGFRETRKWEEEGDTMFAKNRMVSVCYEDLVDDPERQFHGITDLLGVHHIKPTTNLIKQNPESLRDLVANYDELKSEFHGTEWQIFFED